jgi:hypothetical protein
VTDSPTAVYLYGVTRGLDLTALGDIAGVGGAPVREVVAGDLTALVSTVRMDEYGENALRANLEDLGWVEATARAHHDVVDRAARAAPTAPVRIATVYHDDDRVSQVLQNERDRFGAVLDRITGRSEWGVKAYFYPDENRPADVGQNEAATASLAGSATAGGAASGASAGTGTAYLRRRQEQRRRREDAGRQVAEQAQVIQSELQGRAVAVRQHPQQDPRLSGHAGTLILNMAYLLDDEQVQDFLALVRDIDRRTPGIGVEVTGPWPPYSFIDAEETFPEGER